MIRPTYAALATTLACLSLPPATAQRLRAPHTERPSGSGTSFYVSNSGDDANDGRSPAQPWKTIGKVNSALVGMQPCDRVLFHRGDVFRDTYVRLANQVNAGPNTTLQTDPPRFSGNSSCQFTIGAYGNGPAPLIDGADPLSLRWSHVAGNTWAAPLGNPPSKLYVDPPSAAVCATSACPALTPMPNAVTGPGPYHFLDLVVSPLMGGRHLLYGTTSTALAANGQSFAFPYLWHWLRTERTNGATYPIFSTTNTGLQNVEATPASWYFDSNAHTVYVDLRDGSNPASHRFEGTYRPFGVLLQSVNHVTVRDLAIAHVEEDCVLADVYSDTGRGGSYFTNEGNQIIGNQCWNFGSLVAARDPQQTHSNGAIAGILVIGSGEGKLHLMRGNAVTGNNVGTADGILGSTGTTGIGMDTQDGGGAANNLEASHNIVHTTIGAGLNYGGNGSANNNGGRIAYNESYDNQGNFLFGNIDGGRADHNYAHDSYGQGIQIGGASKSDGNGKAPHIIDHNLLVNLGRSSTGTIYNGIDCNTGGKDEAPAGSLDGLWEVNNTMFNTNSAGPTFEPGCTRPHFYNNIVDQNSRSFPFDATSVPNNSFLIYFTPGAINSGFDFGHNLWTPGTNKQPFRGKFDCNSWFSAIEAKNSMCIADPGFIDAQHGNFGLRPGSPAIGYGQAGIGGVGTADAGAIPAGQTRLF